MTATDWDHRVTIAHLAWCSAHEYAGPTLMVIGDRAVVPVAAPTQDELWHSVTTWGPTVARDAGRVLGIVLHGNLFPSGEPCSLARHVDGRRGHALVGPTCERIESEPDETGDGAIDFLLRQLAAAWS